MDHLKAYIRGERGRAGRLAEALGVEPVMVSQWASETKPKRIAEGHCPAIEQLTGIPCEELRPDIRWHRVRAKGWPNGKPLIDKTPEPTTHEA
jgi:DNA-binding transcriptional regulator YdaS (Cro superfamily)